ncbi:MAG: cell division protein SepF [Clostridia bacterium]|nr:cell division protein SepF [Clostridia bacterium]
MDIKNIFGKVQNLRNLIDSDTDEDILENAVSGDDYEDSKKPRRTAKGIFDDDEDDATNVADFSSPYSYSPTAALPKFDSDFSDEFPPIKGIDEAPAPSAEKNGPVLFDIKSAPRASTSKFKLTFISLHDIFDARNVANLMMDKSSIVVVNLSLLSDEQSRRAMDFLDGAKYVTQSVFARFTESICAFIPSDIELHGDFYNQVEL